MMYDDDVYMIPNDTRDRWCPGCSTRGTYTIGIVVSYRMPRGPDPRTVAAAVGNMPEIDRFSNFLSVDDFDLWVLGFGFWVLKVPALLVRPIESYTYW